MSNKNCSSALVPMVTIMCGAAGVTAALLVGATVALSPRQAQAHPWFAEETRLPCGRCHTNPAGGGPITAFGAAFRANGYKLPAKKK
jgi:hypothetical protein